MGTCFCHPSMAVRGKVAGMRGVQMGPGATALTRMPGDGGVQGRGRGRWNALVGRGSKRNRQAGSVAAVCLCTMDEDLLAATKI